MSRANNPAASRDMPKSWSSGRILTESQRQQKRNKDRINKEKRRKKDKKVLEEFELKLSALETQLHKPSGLSTRLTGQCKCSQSVKDAYCMQCDFALCYPLKQDQTYVLKNYGDQLLGQVHHFTRSQVCLNESISQDVLIRAILFGWDDVKTGTFWCPLWEIIYRLDTAIFSGSGLLTRLSMLKTIHSLLQCFMQTTGFRDIPAWYRPRPSQLMFDHDISADYFAWPGLRERLVLTGSQILTDEFFSNFALSFRLIWKQELSAVYAFDPITELYSLSRRFTESLRDIQNWTMDQKFFEAFPEIYYDFTLGI